MDSNSDANSGSGGATGDLWKKVLEEVQTEAAARRSKVGARSAAAPQRSNVEVDLLKRILAAIEARPAGPVVVDHSELLHQILDGIKHPPQLDPALITSPLLAAMEKADHDKRFKELEANLSGQLAALRESMPKPIDPSEQLQAIHEAVRQQPVLDPQAILAPILAAIAKQNVQPSLDHLREEIKQQIQQAAAAAPRPVDITPQLTELRQSVEKAVEQSVQQIIAAVPLPQPVDVEGLVSRLSEAMSAAKPADLGPQLEALRQSMEALPKSEPVDVEAIIARLHEVLATSRPVDIRPDLDALRMMIQSLPQPADQAGKLEEILAAAKGRVDDGRDEILLQILESVQKQATQPATAVSVGGEIGQRIEELKSELKAGISSQLAALPQPVDASAKLQSILDAIAAQPRFDVDAMVQRLRTALQEAVQETLEHSQPESKTDATAAIESLIAQLGELKAAQQQAGEQLAARVESQLKAQLDAHQAVVAAQTSQASQAPAAVDPLPALQSAIQEQAARTQAELQQLREGVQQEIAKQNGQVREDMLAHSIELIDQIKAQSPPSAQELLQLLRSEISKDLAGVVAALPQPADPSEALKARLDAIEQRIAQKIEQQLAQQPTPASIDEAALVARLREAMPTPAAVDTAALVEQIRAALPVPAKVELPELPSYEHDFARQQEMLSDLAQLVKSQTTITSGNGATEAVRREIEKLAQQHRQTHVQLESSISEFAEELETKLESKINSGLAKIELAMATADNGRPPSITADGSESPSASNYRYAWMNQPQPRHRTPAVALTVTAVAAVGMFLVLLINALTGNNNNSAPAAPSNNALASNTQTPPAITPTNPPSTPVTPPATTPPATKGDPAPLPTGPLFPKPTGTGEEPRIAGPLVAELRNLTNPTSERTRVVYELVQARQVVFLVHISGKSPTAMTTILTELKKTLAQLKPEQKFTVVFSEGNRFIEAPPSGLRAGSDGERNRVEGWIDLNIRSTSHRSASSPLVAMDVAVSYQPDLLWIISDAIVSDEPGRVSSKEIIERIATLNPDGSIRIAATQVGSPDTSGTLKVLAEKYGGAYVALGDGSSASLVP